MDINKLSAKYSVRSLDERDAQKVLDLYNSNPLYFKHCPPCATIQSVADDMHALPDGKTLADKHFLGFFDKDVLVAVLDLIEKYPLEHTIFIGLFMVAASYQNKGVGSEIVSSCFENFASSGYTHVRLGYVKTNPQAKSFWQKQGFLPKGIECKQEFYTIVVMDKAI